MSGFYVLHLFCVWPPAYPVAMCLLSLLFLLFHLFFNSLLLLLSYEWQFDFIGCDYPAFENIHGGSHVVVRSGFS